MSNGALSMLIFTGLFGCVSMLLYILTALGVVSLSILWILSPLWISWGLAIALAEASIIYKYFRNQYWK